MDQLLLRPTEAAARLGVSRSTLYRLLAAGVLTSVHIGSARRISTQALNAYVAQLDRDKRKVSL